MIVDEITSQDVNTVGGGETPPSTGLTSNALPEAQRLVAESSQTGVSTRNAHLATSQKEYSTKDEPHWYALRTTYGRERLHQFYGKSCNHFIVYMVQLMQKMRPLEKVE